MDAVIKSIVGSALNSWMKSQVEYGPIVEKKCKYCQSLFMKHDYVKTVKGKSYTMTCSDECTENLTLEMSNNLERQMNK